MKLRKRLSLTKFVTSRTRLINELTMSMTVGNRKLSERSLESRQKIRH